MSWFSSWLPELPSLNLSLALPTSIQGRFLSFVLKRTLGHFFRPGQLDARQIDSQIGSGFVQVNDLELDGEAINNLLSGLPLAFHSGTLSSATARIPWPNPLTSTLGFSLNSLHLAFEVTSATLPVPDVDLVSSVASVAETFLHEELTPREEASLLDSLHSEFPDAIERESLPGGLDPFDVATGEETRNETEAGGISLFATLIERLLSRFEFDARDIKVTIIHPDNVSVTLALSEIRYSTSIQQPETSIGGQTPGVSRSLTVNGVSLQMGNVNGTVGLLQGGRSLTSITRLDAPEHVAQANSPDSSSSSLDEETMMAMSQSLASLPPRIPSPQTAASSMYQSALSVVQEEDEPVRSGATSPPSPVLPSSEDIPPLTHAPSEIIFSSGSTPITVQIITMPPPSDNDHPSKHGDKMTLSLQTGLWACACRPWHIRGLLHLVDAVVSRLPKSTSRPSKQSAKAKSAVPLAALNIEGRLDFRGIVIVLLPLHSSTSADDLQNFFFHPLVPPHLPSGFMRVYVEGIRTSLSLPSQTNPPSQTKPHLSGHAIMKGAFAIHNISIFVFRSGGEGSAFPVLFTDPYLPSQYSSSHHHPIEMGAPVGIPLPNFDILDWTAEDNQKRGATRLSYWRYKPKTRPQTRREPPRSTTAADSSAQVDDLLGHDQNDFAFAITFEKVQKRKQSVEFTIEGRVAPLHFLVDLNNVIGDDTAMTFLEEATRGLGGGGGRPESSDQLEAFVTDDTPPATPRAHHISGLTEERRRLERLELDDLDLGYDYEEIHAGAQSAEASRKQSHSADDVHLLLKLAAVRLEVRVSTPHITPRSGALIFDFHNVELRNGLKKIAHRPHFVTSSLEPPSVSVPVDGQPLFNLECGRIVIAHSLVGQTLAVTLLSLGPLSDNDISESPDHLAPLRPRVSIIKSQANSSVITALNLELPSAHATVSKESLDGVQYFVDDVTQLFERFSRRRGKMDVDRGEGGETSLIGSHFFSKSKSTSTSALMNSTSSDSSETVLKVAISEVFLRAWVPRTDTEVVSIRPFDILASDLNVLMELKPEGREETVITLGVLDINILNVFKTGKTEVLLGLTAPRSLSTAPRPLVKLRFVSSTAPGTAMKETKVKLTMCDFTCNLFPDIDWAKDLGSFVKSPPGTFEAVIPSERTSVVLKIMDGTIRAYAPTKPGAVLLYAGDLDLATDLTGKALESTITLGIQYVSLLAIDDICSSESESVGSQEMKGAAYWKHLGYALVAEVAETRTVVTITKTPPVRVELLVDGVQLHLYLAADTLNSLSVLISDIASAFRQPQEAISQTPEEPVILSAMSASRNLMASVEDIAFQRPPEIGPAPDMIYDDLPNNRDYLDESFGAAAGLREFSDDELEDLDDNNGDDSEAKNMIPTEVGPNGVSNYNGETIKVHSEGINMIEEYYDNVPAEQSHSPVGGIESQMKVRIRGGNVTLFLYEGYDWARTRKVIEEEAKEMRRRLAKIRQLVANGQVQELDMEETNAVLFNSVYIGIDQDLDMTEPGALLEAIDEELKEDVETTTQSSWQSLRPAEAPMAGGGKPRARAPRVHGKKLTRSKGPSMEFKLMGLNIDMDQFFPGEILVSKTFVTVRDVEILDHIKTSTWKKFLTALRSDSKGNIRETDSDMVKIELRGVRPAPGHSSEESRLRAKILPLRLYVDQDAVDFLKKFFSFKDLREVPAESNGPSSNEYIQLAEIFPIDLKLDYKPRRVDYKALREGRTIELMNFFHFDGAEMTLRHITLAGVTGWPRLFEMLNDLWTPDVKATQLVDVISGVAPIRSMVNVGSGVADLVLLPISQYKKDGRIVRGMQKGATAFVKSTAIEAVKMGARLATGTQVILEQAENMLGGQFSDSYTAEILQVPTFDDVGRVSLESDGEEESGSDLISKYAEQPMDIREGFQSAYRSLRRNLNSAAQTILAVPMEVYERSGDEGPVRSVIRAVPIAVLKPMIGASEAISQTLLGLHNTLDPNARRENEAKYKQR